MNERATKTIKTPIEKIEVVINEYMTGGEMMDLEGIAVGAGVKSVDRSGEITMNASEAYTKRLRKLADIMIVSVKGFSDSDEKWKALRTLRAPDYSFVMKEVESAAAGIGATEGKE